MSWSKRDSGDVSLTHAQDEWLSRRPPTDPYPQNRDPKVDEGAEKDPLGRMHRSWPIPNDEAQVVLATAFLVGTCAMWFSDLLFEAIARRLKPADPRS
jgi:hypothetical protein